MSQLFGEVAGDYDEARPGYPPEIVDALRSYHGGAPAALVEVGAGTGLATRTLLALGAPMTCVEPDRRMAAMLTDRFPGVEVVTTAFEEWAPPAGGVPALACAMAWHLLDPATRSRRAYDALAPGGTLAIFGHRYAYLDPAHAAALAAAFRSADPDQRGDRPDAWFRADVADSGLFSDIRSLSFRRAVRLDTAAYLRLVATFSPQLRRPPELRRRVLDAVGAAVEGFGGAVVLDLRTALVLARRPA